MRVGFKDSLGSCWSICLMNLFIRKKSVLVELFIFTRFRDHQRQFGVVSNEEVIHRIKFVNFLFFIFFTRD